MKNLCMLMRISEEGNNERIKEIFGIIIMVVTFKKLVINTKTKIQKNHKQDRN